MPKFSAKLTMIFNEVDCFARFERASTAGFKAVAYMFPYDWSKDQLADNPGRHEPVTGKINFPNLFRTIDDARYDGWIGCETIPTVATEESLGWLAPYKK